MEQYQVYLCCLHTNIHITRDCILHYHEQSKMHCDARSRDVIETYKMINEVVECVKTCRRNMDTIMTS